MPKRYNTPHRSHVVKTRLTDEEYADFTERLAPYGISQSEFLRQAIRRTTIRPVLHVSSVNDELLSAVGKLTAEYGRIGGNLNQIARTLNEWHSPYPAMAKELREAAADLAALKYEVLKKVAWIFHWEPERGTLPPLFEFPMTTFSEKDRFSKFWTQYPLTPKCSAGRGRPHKVMWGACARICRRRSPNRASD